MPDPADDGVLAALIDSWDRSNTILVNLLRAVPRDRLSLRATDDGPTIGQLFRHIHYVRLVFVQEDAPEAARHLPTSEWEADPDVEGLAQMFSESAAAVRDAVVGRLAAGRPMDLHFDHPVLLIQQMIWHEGYHHGQIKLTLKLSGYPLSDDVAGPISWRVWMQKKR
jgi:uncharacterized damage-inducible protein DinB